MIAAVNNDAVFKRAEHALAAVEKRGVSRDGFHSLASLSASDLRHLLDLARQAKASAP